MSQLRASRSEVDWNNFCLAAVGFLDGGLALRLRCLGLEIGIFEPGAGDIGFGDDDLVSLAACLGERFRGVVDGERTKR